MPDQLFIKALMEKNRHLHGRVAMVEKGISIYYPDLWNKIAGYARIFTAAHLNDGRIVIVSSDNGIELALVFLGLMAAGATPLILNRERILAGGLQAIDYYALISDLPAEEICSLHTRCRREANITPGKFNLLLNEDFSGKERREQALLVTSSGSTGLSKIVTLTPDGVIRNIKANCGSLKIRGTDTTLLFLPMSYSYGLIAQFLSHLYAGATIVFADSKRYLLQMASLIPRYSVTTLFTVPAMLRQFLAQQVPGNFPDAFRTLRIVTVGGSHADAHMLNGALRFFLCPIVVTYGLAEAGPRVCTHFIYPNRENDLAVVGKPIGGVKIRILGQKGIPLPQGEPGRVCVISPSVALGYLNSSSANILPGTQVLTNDIGYVTARGRLVILGRMQDFLLVNNKRIWFIEIEDLLYATGKLSKVYLEKEGDVVRLQLLKMSRCALTCEEVLDLLRRKFGKELESRITIGFAMPSQVKMIK
jgi:long-chain acyl-CoA synthetase